MTNQELADRCFEAIVKILLAYDKASFNDQVTLDICLRALYEQRQRILNKPNLLSEPITALTKAMKDSKGALEAVVARRQRLKNSLVSAQEILDALTPVIALL
jgi:hypothetical protein